MEYKENTDFISDLLFVPHKKTLIASSGDGSLSVFDIRKSTLFARSQFYEDDLLSLALIKGGKAVVAGSQMGYLNIFEWGFWGDVSDRFPGHPLSVDTICPYDDDVCFTGSSDGLIRCIQIHPNRFFGIIGSHDDFPVEQLKLHRNKHILASLSHDMTVAFWDVKDFERKDDDEESIKEEEAEEEEEKLPPKKAKLSKQTDKKKSDNAQFFADLD